MPPRCGRGCPGRSMAVQPRRRHSHEPRHRTPHHRAGRGRPGRPPGAPRRRQDRPPGDAGWDEARRAWNLAVDQRPGRGRAARVRRRRGRRRRASPRAHGLRVAPQGTGHGATALGSLERHDPAQDRRACAASPIDPEARHRARRGRRRLGWRSSHAAAEHGLAALAGSSPDVGVVGYTLGGGLSWLGRQATASPRTASPRSSSSPPTACSSARREDVEPELFWALRGGGGSFGVVTALEFAPVPDRARSTPASLFCPIERASEVLHAWRELGRRRLPDETHVGRPAAAAPADPGDPGAAARHARSSSSRSTTLGDEARGRRAARAAARARPGAWTRRDDPDAARCSHLHMDPEHPVPGAGDGDAARRAAAREAIDALVAVAGPGSGSPLLSVELRHLGGALGRPRAGARRARRRSTPRSRSSPSASRRRPS